MRARRSARHIYNMYYITQSSKILSSGPIWCCKNNNDILDSSMGQIDKRDELYYETNSSFTHDNGQQ